MREGYPATAASCGQRDGGDWGERRAGGHPELHDGDGGGLLALLVQQLGLRVGRYKGKKVQKKVRGVPPWTSSGVSSGQEQLAEKDKQKGSTAALIEKMLPRTWVRTRHIKCVQSPEKTL